MRNLLCICILLICIGCKEKHTQNIILTPRNDELRKKMEKWGCECLYDEVKNRFFYNRNTGLYFGGTGYLEEYKNCYKKLSINEFYQLYGPPHIEDNEFLYYYCNVRYCGQHFDGFKFKKNENGKIVEIKTHVQENIFPNDDSKKFNVRCRSVDYIDKEKMRINQGFFNYFSADFVHKHFDVADYIEVQPMFENSDFSERCLENIRYSQYNFLFNKQEKYFIGNYTYVSRAFPLMGHDDEEYASCQLALNKPEYIVSAYGQPSYISDSKDTIVYVLNNKLHKGRTPNRSYIWDGKYEAFMKKILYNLREKYLPKVKNDCEITP